MRDITDLMNLYRECSRNLWNVYFSRRPDIGTALDAFEEIRAILFDSLVLNELLDNPEITAGEPPPPVLRVIPRARTLILVRRPSDDGNWYWDAEKDLIAGPDDIQLVFLDYFDFSQIPIKDFRFYRCKIVSFSNRAQYEGREALIETVDGRVSHDEEQNPDLPPVDAKS